MALFGPRARLIPRAAANSIGASPGRNSEDRGTTTPSAAMAWPSGESTGTATPVASEST